MPVRRHAGKWEARVQHSGRRVSKTFENRRDAQEWERRYRGRLEDLRIGRTPDYSLEEALERWLTGEAAGLRSHADLVKKVRVIYPFAKGQPLTNIVAVAEALKADALEHKAAPATVNRKLAVLRRVARLAYRQWGWLDQGLGDRITMLPGERQRHTYLTPTEVRRIALAAPRRVRDAIYLAALTGLRRGELLALKASDRKNGALILQHTKNGRPRIVPLPPEVAGIRLPIGLTTNQLDHGFRDARDAAGLPDARFHDLRHTYASWLIQGGASLTAARDLLGHSSLAVTSRYSHLSPKHLVDAVTVLPRVVGQKKKRAA